MPPTIDDEFDDFDLDDPDLLAAVDQIEKDYKAPRKPVAGAAPKASVSAPGRALSVPQAKKPVQTRGVALPKQPVYEDEFPPVQLDANGTYKKWVDPKDAERTQLQAQVAELRQALEKERKQRQAKEGEATQLRTRVQQSTKEQEELLAKETAKAAALQDQVAKLVQAAAEDQKRHQHEILFARQEHESAVRQRVSATQRPGSKGRNGSATKPSPKKPKIPEKKGFQNSFAESTTVKGGTSAGLRSSPTEARPEVRRRSSATTPAQLVNGKGKGRAFQEDDGFNTDSQSTFIGDSTFVAGDDPPAEEEEDAPLSAPKKDRMIAFLFGHPTSPYDAPSKTVQALLNAKLRPDAPSEANDAHRKACQALFECLSRVPTTSAMDVETQDRSFLAQVLLAVTSFAELFASQNMASELVLVLALLRDLLFTFQNLIFHQDLVLEEHTKATKAIFGLLIHLVRQQQSRYMAYLQKRKQANNRSGTQLSMHKAAHKDTFLPLQPAVWQAKEVDPTFLAVLPILGILAWRPDSTCLSSWDAALRESDFLATLLDPGRSSSIHLQTLQIILMLAGETSLYRVLLATPVFHEPNEQAAMPTTLPAPGSRLPLVDIIAPFLQYKHSSPIDNHSIQQAVLDVLCTLAVGHADGIALLGSSSSLVQRIIVKNSTDAAILYDSPISFAAPVSYQKILTTMDSSLSLLYTLVMSSSSKKTLALHLVEKPVGREWFVSGVGRIACTYVPEWVEDPEVAARLDQLAEMAHELLAEVLAPDEIEDLWALCHDDDEEEDAQDAGEQDAERMANENMQHLDSR